MKELSFDQLHFARFQPDYSPRHRHCAQPHYVRIKTKRGTRIIRCTTEQFERLNRKTYTSSGKIEWINVVPGMGVVWRSSNRNTISGVCATRSKWFLGRFRSQLQHCNVQHLPSHGPDNPPDNPRLPPHPAHVLSRVPLL